MNLKPTPPVRTKCRALGVLHNQINLRGGFPRGHPEVSKGANESEFLIKREANHARSQIISAADSKEPSSAARLTPVLARS